MVFFWLKITLEGSLSLCILNEKLAGHLGKVCHTLFGPDFGPDFGTDFGTDFGPINWSKFLAKKSKLSDDRYPKWTLSKMAVI